MSEAKAQSSNSEESGRKLQHSPTLERMLEAQEQEKRIQERMALIKHKIMVLSGKGGVGKTTVVAALARELARRGYSVGALDVDIHGPNLPAMLGVRAARASGTEDAILPVQAGPNLKVMSIGFVLREETQPVIWRGPLKAGLIRQFLADVEWGQLDFLLVDNPPGTGDEPLSIAQLIPNIDGAVIVSQPQEMSLMDCRKAINFANALHVPVLGVIENMSGFVCPHCGKDVDVFGSGGAQRMAEEMRVRFLGRIPLFAGVAEFADAGASLVAENAPAPIRQALITITDNLLQALSEEENTTEG